ncbi:hypothetical protein NAP1_09037 [Erythrobacter sp. NAP1]|uniref:hypothetical protein n=1 Tax=Erythrobacter sp. NAP1 TaxID=237727 RepID=UPI000068516E|nr:hypothetical protein [Erythrobacter sp. NAP1]EAQ27726.1 hypothetical protein NAP1_09037 [Erythrobacter sp. NAP1]
MSPDAAAVIIPNLPWIIGGALAVGGAGVLGWIYTTKLRIQNGYPLDGSWGQALHPKTDHEAKQRVTLLTQENAELRAELGSVKDRLANVERIVTDSGYHLSSEIDQLKDRRLEDRKDEGNA